MCPAITEEVAAGRFCGEKKGSSDGRNSAEAVVFAIGNPVEPRSDEKLSDLWALREMVWVIFWWKGLSIFLDPIV